LHEGIEVGTRPAHICVTGKGIASETQNIRLTTSQSPLETPKMIRTSEPLLRRQDGQAYLTDSSARHRTVEPLSRRAFKEITGEIAGDV
jgi:hypothetical protein